MPSGTRSWCLRSLPLLFFSLFCLPLGAQSPAVETHKEPVTTESGSSTTLPAPALAHETESSIKLAEGDLVELNVFGVPELTTKARISNSGDLYLPLIDYVHIADLTVDEAQELVQKRLADGGFVRNPHVSIYVDESAAQAINVLGEVMHPGPYPAIGDPHLYSVLASAGGLTEKTNRTVTIMHRGNLDDKVELHLPLDLAEDPKNNVALRAGDTVLVQRAGIVYVVGDVNRPSGFMIEDSSLTVLKAYAMAGGGTRTASLNGSRLLRQTPTGVQEIPIQLKKMLHAKIPDIPMVRGDLLFVPGSPAKGLAYKSVDAAFTMATSVAIVAAVP
jgi:polysaccharide export outer membrane protein